MHEDEHDVDLHAEWAGVQLGVGIGSLYDRAFLVSFHQLWQGYLVGLVTGFHLHHVGYPTLGGDDVDLVVAVMPIGGFYRVSVGAKVVSSQPFACGAEGFSFFWHGEKVGARN